MNFFVFWVTAVAVIIKVKGETIPQCKDIPHPQDPEECLPSDGIIRRWGYPAESHNVTTSDGYILGLFRIPYGKTGNSPNRPVVFLQHGLLGCSDTWLTNLPSESLAYILADAGYDVWLGNVRGDRYSRAHVRYDPDRDKKQFWDFSWQDMADKDLPAMINYALQTAGQNQLEAYIAHSQGTLIGFAEFCSDLEFSSKIKTYYALAPVAHLGHITSNLKYLANPLTIDALQTLFHLFGVYEYGTSDSLDERLSQWFCANQLNLDQKVCSSVIDFIEGFDAKYTNNSRMPIYLTHTPAGTSVKNLVHFAQLIYSKQLQKFDYGPAENRKVYGQSTPPIYPVQNMRVPTLLFSGGEDSLADPTDVDWLVGQIGGIVLNHTAYSDFNHLDFTYGLGAAPQVYPIILDYLKLRKN